MPLVWNTAEDLDDDNPCPLCRPLNGKRDGDGWTSNPRPGSDDIGPPPRHPNCRCFLTQERSELEQFVNAIR